MVQIQLTDDDMKERKNTYFEEGIHEVVITAASRGKTDAGKEYIEFTVLGQNDEEDTVRMWLTTEKAAKYTLSILVGIAVHNKDTETEKQTVRENFKKITDTDQVNDKFLQQQFVNKDAWFTVYKSERTYTNAQGETKNSYDKNIYGYAPTPKKSDTVNSFIANGTPDDSDEVPFN